MPPPEGEAAPLGSQLPCRNTQIAQLQALLSPIFPSPKNLVVHGLPCTGKTAILTAVLASSTVPYAVVNCREAVTPRHLFERTILSILDALDDFSEKHGDWKADRRQYVRTENVSALNAHIQHLLSLGLREPGPDNCEEKGKFFLCFDDVDEIREASLGLLPALARLSDATPYLTVVFTLKTPHPRLFHRPGIPHVQLPAYTRSQAIRIVSLAPPTLPDSVSDGQDQGALEQLFPCFAATVWDSLAKHGGRDVVSFRETCLRLWPAFTKPVVDGRLDASEISRLVVAARGVFQSEEGLLGSFELNYDDDNSDVEAERLGSRTALEQAGQDEGEGAGLLNLPYFARYILIAAYLASHNPARTDPTFFAEWSEKRRKRRRKKRGLGSARKDPQTPRPLLSPSSFPLPRLLAILNAVLPDAMPAASPHATDVLGDLSTLTGLGLLNLAGGGGGDLLDPGCKWKANIGWDTVVPIGQSVGCEVADYVFE